MASVRPADRSSDDRPRRNKALVLEAITSLFQRRDASAVERLYAADYIQHNPKIPQGRKALQAIVAELPEHVYFEPGVVVAGDELGDPRPYPRLGGRTADCIRYLAD